MLTIYEKQPLKIICNINIDITNATKLAVWVTNDVDFDEKYDALKYESNPQQIYCNIEGGILPATDQMIFRAVAYFDDPDNPYYGEPKYIAIDSLAPPLKIGTRGQLTLRDYRYTLRMYLKDFDQNNRLLNFTTENEIEYLDTYIYMALSFFNLIPPLINAETLGTFPIPNLIIHQATVECLLSNSIVFSRNDLTYNNGGVTLKVSDANRYAMALQQLYREIDIETNMYRQYKIAKNIMSAYGGGVASPYAYLHGRYATLQPNSLFAGR
jgi:hypothetical protein